MAPFAVLVAGCILLPFGIGACAWHGHRIGRRLISANQQEISTGVVDAAVLSLLGLLTAFTFSGAYARYESRRHLIVEEVNAIGTAYLRLDLLPTDKQQAMRSLFRDYVKSRYKLWELLPDRQAAELEYANAEALQKRIWELAELATRRDSGDARKLLLPALNAMIDITTTRMVAIHSHPPRVIFLLLGFLWLAAGWIGGFSMAKMARLSRVHIVGFALVAALAMYVIVDIEFPRFGLVTLDATHQLFISLERQMN